MAQITLPQDTLKEVKVVAKQLPAKNNAGNPSQTLNEGDLEKLNSISVADAVKHLSGVQLKDYGGIGGLKTINVRSLGSQHTGIFYDGILLGNAQNGEIDLGKFSLDNIGSIELYNGQRDQIFQPASAFTSASSLYLNSGIPVFKEDKRSHVNFTFRTGSFGLVNPFFRFQQKITERIFSTVSGGWEKANGKYPFHYRYGNRDSLVTRTNTDVNALRLEAGLNGTFTDSSSWTLKFYSYQSDRGLPGATISNKLNASQRLWNEDIFVQTSYLKSIGKRYYLLLNGKYSHSYTRYLDPEYLNDAHLLDNRYNEEAFYISAANKFALTSFWDVALSTDFLANGMEANLYQFAEPFRQTGLVALASELHVNRFNLQGSLLATLVEESVKTGRSARYKNVLSPSLAVSWQPFKQGNLQIRGFYKEGFRLPTFNDLYYTLIGNAKLLPEYTKQYNLGITYRKGFVGAWEYISFRADVYNNRVKDKIIAIPTANLFRWSMVNLGLVNINGVETGLQSAIKVLDAVNLDVSLNYTWQQALDITAGGYNYKQQIPYTPVNSGSAFIGLIWKNTRLNYNYLYTGKRYSQREHIAQNKMQPWYTSDIGASYKIDRHKIKYKLLAEVNNMWNQDYAAVYNYPMPGRSCRFTLSMHY
ncbi:MAG: TonB-dependent receptor plug domain-containing protein [Sphingobacteriaceae bacterium]